MHEDWTNARDCVSDYDLLSCFCKQVREAAMADQGKSVDFQRRKSKGLHLLSPQYTSFLSFFFFYVQVESSHCCLGLLNGFLLAHFIV